MKQPLELRLSASMLRLRRASPFFATLAMHTRFIEKNDLPTAATDGHDVFYNSEFLGSLTDTHLDGVLLHEVLHAALAHVHRRGRRDPRRWNIAADVVVNGLVLGNNFDLPEGHVRDTVREGLSVEEVYAAMEMDPPDPDASPDFDDLLEPTGDSEGEPSDPDGRRPGSGSLRARKAKALEAHWERIANSGATAQRANGRGELPAGVARAFGLDVPPPTVDWRSILWQFVSRSRSDFASFDRRFAYRGLFLESLDNEDVWVDLCIDTSGSIDQQALSVFSSELDAILRAHPSVRCRLWYADANVYGPWELGGGDELPEPQGGGGTDFSPFFEALESGSAPSGSLDGSPSVSVYLTDGHGTFPAVEPTTPTLWVVTPGGAADETFPFGEVVRLGGT